ncbi:MAG: hypothetical protein HY725_19470 [Candidatus Rokubacteria bacterium]|nr:hypothetical protein [Candidatus Rokubacteria bacterium]
MKLIIRLLGAIWISSYAVPLQADERPVGARVIFPDASQLDSHWTDPRQQMLLVVKWRITQPLAGMA